MKITNRDQLPEVLVRAVTRDPYDRGDSWRTVTQLVTPPRIVQLLEDHDAVLEEDVADNLWRLFGSAMHVVLERAACVNALTEQRLYKTVRPGLRISGQYDSLVLDPGEHVLEEHKFPSVWAIRDGLKEEWLEQVQYLALLVREAGTTVHGARINCIFRDWRPSEALNYPEWYPPRAKSYPVQLWSETEACARLEARVQAHLATRTALPACTDAERWTKPTQYVVMKPGRKTALRVLDTHLAAEVWKGDVPGLTITVRPGKHTRCADGYCPVTAVCTQWQAERATAGVLVAEG